MTNCEKFFESSKRKRVTREMTSQAVCEPHIARVILTPKLQMEKTKVQTNRRLLAEILIYHVIVTVSPLILIYTWAAQTVRSSCGDIQRKIMGGGTG